MPRQRRVEPSRRKGAAPIPRQRLLALPIGGLCLLLLTAWALSCNMLDRSGSAEPDTIGAGGGGQACAEPSDCPGLFTECQHAICVNGICGTHYEPTGTACTENEGTVCDSVGECVECVDETQCSGDELCQANECVPAYCGDGVLNGDETDLDCGGSCAPCENGAFCGEGSDCLSGYCASNGICAPCSAHGDCDLLAEYCCVDGMEDCDPGVCAPKEAGGSECDDPVECVSGFCPGQDRVCCDSACDGHCYACLDGKNDDAHGQGECGPVAADTDPESECGAEPSSTCGSDGRGCDGAGACLLWPSGTVCDPQHCAGGDSQHYDDTCDGSGSCDDSGIDNCSPYICDGSACRTSCTGDAHCLSGAYCAAPNCVSSGGQGDPCGADNQCQSGHCEDGRCCESVCSGECMACSSAKTGQSNGMCRSILSDTDPDGECSNGACYRIDTASGECRLYQGYSCGGNGDCMNNICRDGYCCENSCSAECMACRGDWTVGSNGQCRAITSYTDPADECANGACYNNSGTGDCRLYVGYGCGSSTDCLYGNCVDGRCCENSCTSSCMGCRGNITVGSDGQCRNIIGDTDPNNDCQSPPANNCDGSGSCQDGNGNTCSNPITCTSGYCVDGYCCNSSCGGTCVACRGDWTVGSSGTCSNITTGDDYQNECGQDPVSSCDRTGECEGGACQLYSAGTQCEARYCVGETEYPPSDCDGSGTCQDGGSYSCEPYICDGDHCRSDCTNNGHCYPGYYCNASNVCFPY